MIAFLAILAASRSETDCFPNPPNVWTIHGTVVGEDTFKISDGSDISYSSDRQRKKWQMSICSNFSDVSLVFQSDEIVSIHFVNDSTEVLVKGYKSDVEEKFKKYSEAPDCFTLLYGRGSFVLFPTPEDGAVAKDVLSFDQITIPRGTRFSFTANKAISLSRLCMGDFIGEKRLDLDYDERWDLHVRDFL